MSERQNLVPAMEVERSPGRTFHCSEDKKVLKKKPAGEHLRIWQPPTTPEVATPSTSARPTADSARPHLKARRGFMLKDEAISTYIMDSGSEIDDSDEDDDEVERWMGGSEDDQEIDVFSDDEREEVGTRRVGAGGDGFFESILAVGAADRVQEVLDKERVVNIENEEDLEQPTLAQAYEGLDVFTWSDDYTTFSGQEETYLRNPGPTVRSQDPVEIFCNVWDEEVMARIVHETNEYAWKYIAALSESERGIPKYLEEWTEVTVEELYRFFAIIMLMTFCQRSRLRDYWTTGVIEMAKFRKLMSKNRYVSIYKFLHFVNNEELDRSMSSYDKKIFKIRPIVDHLNRKSVELYVPNKHLSLDESLLLWKSRLSWVQYNRTKAARIGIKSYHLCEAVTGYQLRCLLYAGKDSTMIAGPIHGFKSCTAKVVLELMDGFLDLGHTLVMDNWYNQLSMTRFLKLRKTDVIGTMNTRRVHVPDEIKNADKTRMARGEQIARHCGDISLVAWNDVKLVTAVSTHHTDERIPARRAGVNVMKPAVIAEYNKYMGGVDRKDQKLSMFLLERKRGQKWYKKVFKRLLNTSILNAYVIYSRNPTTNPRTHRQFREDLAIGLLKKSGIAEPCPSTPSFSRTEAILGKNERRLIKNANHFPQYTEHLPGKRVRKQLRCVRCTMKKRRTMVTLMCSFCLVPLCPGPCWAEYHTLEKLK